MDPGPLPSYHSAVPIGNTCNRDAGNELERLQRFHDLMRRRVRDILLVSSSYDSFILSEDGSLYESLLNEYIGLGLTHMPAVTRVSSGLEALRMAQEPGRYDLVLCTLRLGDMAAVDFARSLRERGVEKPVILLSYDERELADLERRGGARYFDRVFLWQGDFRVLLAIIKYVEDRWNVDADTRLVGVQSIILIEDSVRYYSSYLPLVYTAILEHTAELIAEGVNPAHKILRMRARPKILLCSTYEEAWGFFERFHEHVLGVISDIEFPNGGSLDREAGFAFARAVRGVHPDIAVLLQSNEERNRGRAEVMGATFLRKDSDSLLHELREFMRAHFGFGDFVFRLRDGTVVARARDLRELEEMLERVPAESIAYHGERNDFSTWLKARTEFLLAHRLRPVHVSEFESIEDVRAHLIRSLREARRDRERGSVVDFDPDMFDETLSFARLGGGSLGGKGRGLAFANRLLVIHGVEDAFEGIRIRVPPSIVLGTDVFDAFIERNDLWEFAVACDDDEEIVRRFRAAPFPEMIAEALRAYLVDTRDPLSVRSSSLLEDSQLIPFAGVYETVMVPNAHRDVDVRLDQLLDAVKRVYASTFCRGARRYVRSTPYRVEEEKMAVIIQRLVGRRHGRLFYPDVSGVARSHNFYPIHPMKAEDGIALVALGLGRQVVEGGAAVRFCPRYPRHLVQFSSVEDALDCSQKTFWALEMSDEDSTEPPRLVRAGLDVAERDGTLRLVGSTYDRDNHALYDGVSRPGVRVITFAPILKYDELPLPAVLERILELGQRGMSSPVEIEFAVTVPPGEEPAQFHLLQMRPMVVAEDVEGIDDLPLDGEDLFVASTCVMGQGVVREIRDVVYVDVDRFDRAHTHEVAREVAAHNTRLVEAQRPYLLIGIGRWGSSDPWLGIPVRWDDISGARVIVECGMRDIKVTPSQGTHFFQNITALRIGYITIEREDDENFVDWRWLRGQRVASEGRFTRHVELDAPLTVVLDARRSRSAILKPVPDAGTATAG